MTRHIRGSSALVATVLLAGVMASAQPLAAAAEPRLRIGQVVTGSIFVDDDDTAEFTLETSARTVHWQVYDSDNALAAQGSSDGEALELPRLPLGHYVLVVTASQGGPVARATTSFALIEGWRGERDARFGMNTKFGLPADGQPPVWDSQLREYSQRGTPRYDLDLVPVLEQTGAAEARDTVAWNQFEPEPGLYTGGPPSYHAYTGALDDAGVTPLVILSYGNRLYDVDGQGVGAAPYSEQGIRAYAEYARAVLESYDGVVQRVEVWNEYNGDATWNRGPCRLSARCYYEMLKVTYEVVKETHPEAQVGGPAAVEWFDITSGTLPYDWLDELFSYGALDYLDAVTVHPYGLRSTPEGYRGHGGKPGLDSTMTALDELVRLHNDGRSKPIWSTEIGWGSYPGPSGVTPSQQAARLVRSHVLSFAGGVDTVHWYSLRNDAVAPTEPGANWGLVRDVDDPLGRYAPKESFTAYSTMTRQLSGARLREQEEGPEGVRSYRFATPGTATDVGEDVRVMWAPNGARGVSLATADSVVVTTMDGQRHRLSPFEGHVHLTLRDEPVYVVGSVQELLPGELLTMSAADADTGELTSLTLGVDGDRVRRATPARFEVVGLPEQVQVVAPPGRSAERTITIEAGDRAGPRTVVAEVSVAGRTAGLLSADLIVRPGRQTP